MESLYHVKYFMVIRKEDRKGNAEQLERLTNSELQKLFVNDKAGGEEQVREKRSHKKHLENLRNLHEQSK